MFILSKTESSKYIYIYIYIQIYNIYITKIYDFQRCPLKILVIHIYPYNLNYQISFFVSIINKTKIYILIENITSNNFHFMKMKIGILKWLWTIFSTFKNFQLPKIAFSIVATKTKTIENSEFLMWIPNRISHHNLSNISVTRVSFNRITSKEKTDDSVSILHSSFLILFYGNADHPEYFPPCHVTLPSSLKSD